MDFSRDWEKIENISARSFICGYSDCNKEVASDKGFIHHGNYGDIDGIICICPKCKRPTFFDVEKDIQIPGIIFGSNIDSLPQDIDNLWKEIRGCIASTSYTSAVLSGRKMLMHIAVSQGAEEDLTFLEYVDYLVDNHFAPPNSKDWIDKIRKQGNEANHEIVIKQKEDAQEIAIFLEMLLKFIYEFPSR